MMSSTHQNSPSWRARSAVTVLGLAVLVFIWAVYHYHNHQVFHERLRAEGTEHLNLALIIAQNTKQLAERAKVLGGIYQTEALDDKKLSRLLAADPVFNRISIYDSAGSLVFSNVHPSLKQLPAMWLEQLHATGNNKTIVPPTLLRAGSDISLPQWRLPFLVPFNNIPPGQTAQVMLFELDIGYLLSLYQHIDLGKTGFIQLLDEHNQEWLRADSSGVIFAGAEVLSSLPDDGLAGIFRSSSSERTYLSAYNTMQHGVTVVIHKGLDEIQASINTGKKRLFFINVIFSLLVILAVTWLLKLLLHQQLAMQDLQNSQKEKQKLIATLKNEHERSNRAASTDHLSGLFNRRQFIEAAGKSLSRRRNKRRIQALLFIDLDRFKSINDTLGHRIGDLLLQAVAGRITRLLEANDIAARFGGDEFVVLLAAERTEQEIVSWVDTLAKKLAAMYQLEGVEVNTSGSIGVALCPRDGIDVDSLILYADAAMYSSKRSGRGQYRFYDPSLNVVDVEEFRLEQGLREALDKHQFVLHYQPQISLENMSIISYEALVRWQHPEFGLVYPARFISIAERSGFIAELGLEVIHIACRQLANWASEGKTCPIAVNVSALQLGQEKFAENILSVLKQYKLEASLLELEITETAILEHKQLAIDSLNLLRKAGISVSLDDFGTGYAGFAHLNALPVNRLKIDRSLITELSNTHDDSHIVSSTITLAKRLSLQVIAEGVETLDQLVYLRLAGCDIGQGYLFSRPLEAGQIADFENKFRKENKICV